MLRCLAGHDLTKLLLLVVRSLSVFATAERVHVWKAVPGTWTEKV